MRDNNYYQIHKEVYNLQLQQLESDIIKIIFDDPHGEEAYLFNKRVESEVEERLSELNVY
jgi:hypothetical protein